MVWQLINLTNATKLRIREQLCTALQNELHPRVIYQVLLCNAALQNAWVADDVWGRLQDRRTNPTGGGAPHRCNVHLVQPFPRHEGQPQPPPTGCSQPRKRSRRLAHNVRVEPPCRSAKQPEHRRQGQHLQAPCPHRRDLSSRSLKHRPPYGGMNQTDTMPGLCPLVRMRVCSENPAIVSAGCYRIRQSLSMRLRAPDAISGSHCELRPKSPSTMYDRAGCVCVCLGGGWGGGGAGIPRQWSNAPTRPCHASPVPHPLRRGAAAIRPPAPRRTWAQVASHPFWC